MNILYTCDDNYVWLMGISMISLFVNNKAVKDLDVYLLGDNISKKNKGVLMNIAKSYNRNCTIIEVSSVDIPETLISKRWPISAFIRLYAGVLLPDKIKKVMYLDCDTIVRGEIEEAYLSMPEDRIISGVKDCIGKEYLRNIGLKDKSDIYINAGVLVLNLEALRKVNIKNEINEYLNIYKKRINYADQDILNGIFRGDISVLKPEYNIMTIIATYQFGDVKNIRRPVNYYSKSEIESAIRKAKVVHYTSCMLNIRPWYQNTNHVFFHDFNKYFKMSPWKERKLNEFKFETKEAKILKSISRFPKKIQYKTIGIIHSILKPRFIYLKSIIK